MVTREELKRSAKRELRALAIMAALAVAYVLGGLGSGFWQTLFNVMGWGAR